MRSFFNRVLVQQLLALTLCLLLTACGGSGSESPAPVSEQPPVTPVPPPPVGGTPVELGVMVNFGYNSLAAGAPLRSAAVQTLAVGNGTANYRFPRSGESISGNLTIALDVADPDGLARVLVGFNGSEQALVLCSANCGLSFSRTVTGVNPRDFGLNPGSIRLELWLEDLLGNRVLFDARDIEWLPEPVVGVNTNRTGSALQVNWSANSNASRYNLYIAEQPGLTPANVLSKPGGRQFLALSQPGFSIAVTNPATRYFVLVTGVDSSGESLYSAEHIVQPVGAPEFSLPVAIADQFSLNEDTTLTGDLLANDSHPDGTSFSLNSVPVRLPENGTLQLNADGSFSYQPAANFSGNDSFIYQITDARELTAEALVSLTVLPVNDAPVPQNDSYSLNKNTTLTVVAPGLLANDSDIDSSTLVVNTSPVTPASHGTVQLNADGAFSYTPTTNYAGEDFFVYQLTDEQGAQAEARVDLRIEMTNAAPIAQNDSYQLNEDERLIVGAQAGILANDSDPDGDVITLVTDLVTPVSNGQLILAPDGSFQYIPNQDFFGTDSFSYQIKDPAGLVSSATVLVQVLPQNDPPVVQASSYAVDQDGVLSVAAPGLLIHSSDVDDEQLTVVTVPVVAPAKGVLTLSANGAFSYQPNAGVSGTDSFSYQVRDAAGAVTTGVAAITIVATPEPPVLSDRSLQILDIQSQGAVLTQLAVESSAPGVSISFSLVGGDPQGVFNLTQSGVLSVANAASLAELGGRVITLRIQAEDSNGRFAQANLTISVVSTAITANDDSYDIAEDTVLNSDSSVLNNDLDPSGRGLTAALVNAPAHGSVSLDSDGRFQYSPNQNFYGQDSFVYSASNGTRSAQATVVIQIAAVNDAPVLEGSSFTVSAAAAQGQLIGQLNWQDADTDQSYTFAIVSGDSSQAFSITSQGQLIVANSAALNTLNATTSTLLVEITDSGGASASAAVIVQILSATPVVQADAYRLDQGTVLQVDAASGVLANDSDPAASALTASLVSGPASGQLSLNPDGSFSYQPTLSFFGQDSFVYRASNGVQTAEAIVTLDVKEVIPFLEANPDTYTLAEDSVLTVPTSNSVLQNDVIRSADPAVNVVLVQGPASGTLNLNTDGTFSYQPALNVFGTYSFTYRLTQGIHSSADAQVQLNITPVNDAPSLQDASATISTAFVNLQNVLTLSVSDVDPGSYSFEILSGNTAGIFGVTSAGVLRIANAASLAAGTYNLLVRVTEDNDAALTDTATVVITVTAPLQANADSYTLDEDTLLTVTSAESVLQNDSYSANPAATVSLVTGPPAGTLTLNSDGTFTYQPALNAYGSYYFTYRLTQGTSSSDAQVELNITSVNDAPSLSDATATINDAYVDLQDVLTLTVVDPDPGSYQFEIVSGDTGNVFSVTSGGVIKVANAAALNAVITPTYNLMVQVTEDADLNLTDTATITINVTGAVQGDITDVVPDTNFAGGGELSLQMMLSGEYNDPVEIIPLSDGRSLVVGTVHSTGSQELFVMRLNVDGSVDTSYADDGLFRNKILSVSIEEEAVAAVLTGADELVVLANYTDSVGSGFFLFRLNSAGGVDASFGGGLGYLLCPAPECETNATATDLILDNAGKYVVSGTRIDLPSAVTEAFLYQFIDAAYFNGNSSVVGTVNRFDLVRQDSSGNYYAIGQSSAGHIVVARYLSDLTLDTTNFGPGYFAYSFGLQSSIAYDAVIYDNGSSEDLYVVGSVTDAGPPVTIDGLFFKVNALDGSLDSSFGNAGLFQVNGFSDNPLRYSSVSVGAAGFYILTGTETTTDDLLSVSKYSLTGLFEDDEVLSSDGELKAVQINSSGPNLWLLGQLADPGYGAIGDVSFNWVGKYQSATLSADTSFSGNGQRWFNAGFGSDILLGTQRLTMGGQIHKTLFYGYSYAFVNGSYEQAFIGRLTASGALDQSFGNHGVVLLKDDQLAAMRINSVLEVPGDKIYIAGYGSDSTVEMGYVLRLSQDGSQDPTFGSGVVDLVPDQLGTVGNYGDYDASVAVQLQLTSTGKLLVGAEYSLSNDNRDAVLLQFNTDGTPDSSFGIAGYTVFSALDPSGYEIEHLNHMQLDPADGTVVIAGQFKPAAEFMIYVARFTVDGLIMNPTNSPSDVFGSSGAGYSLINLTSNPVYFESVNDLTFDAGRHLILALSKGFEGDDTHYIHRLEPDGLADPSFNAGQPKPYTSFSNSVTADLEISDILIDDDDRLLIAGRVGADAWIGRLLMDGSASQPGRWDPAFEFSSAIKGAYVFTGFGFTSDLRMELTGNNKLMLGWSKFVTPGYQFTFRQFQLDEYDPHVI